MERFRAVLYPASSQIGLQGPEIERGAFRSGYEHTLVSEGLLDVSGKIKRPTQLGRVLLQYASPTVGAGVVGASTTVSAQLETP